MSTITTISIPQEWLKKLFPEYLDRCDDKEWLKAQVKEVLIRRVLANAPVDVNLADTSPRDMINLSLAAPAGPIAVAQSQNLGLSLGPYCKKLLAGAVLEAPAVREVEEMPADAAFLVNAIRTMAQRGQQVQPRLQQAQHFVQLKDAMNRGMIGLCEAGTGTGKTLAMLAAAAEVANGSGQRVVIAVPTLGLIDQMAAKYRDLATSVPEIPPLRTILGRREFISPTALFDFLENADLPEEQDIIAWFNAGGPAPQGQALQMPWLTSSLLGIAPAFPVHEAILPDVVEQDDPGLLAYKSAFADDRGVRAEIVLCTHAMLAQDLRSRGRMSGGDSEYKELRKTFFGELRQQRAGVEVKEDGIEELQEQIGERYNIVPDDRALMPAYRYLLVDEAHLLEQNVSSSMSDHVSLFALLRTLRQFRANGGKLAAKKVDMAEESIRSLAAISLAAQVDQIHVHHHDKTAEWIQKAFRTLIEIAHSAGVSKNATTEARALQLALRRMSVILKSALQARPNWHAGLNCSPVRRFPQVSVGRTSVDGVLQTMWQALTGGAAVSATLYIKRNDGYSAGFQRAILAIPQARAVEYPPVFAPWQIATVAGVWTPAAVTGPNGLWLRPPTRSDKLKPAAQEEAEQRWLAEVAAEIPKIDATAAGGMLVLMTSYRSVETIAALLPELASRLVVAGPDLPMAAQSHRFLTLSRSGVKPIWFAVGAAWTGLDIGGHDPWRRLFGSELPAAEDNVLTDLVIPRLPYGTNRSITHAYRISQKPHVQWEMLETAFRLRQGIGRAVRRGSLPANRRIFVLDGRLNDPVFSNTLANVRNTLGQYKQFSYTPQFRGEQSFVNAA